MLIFFFFFKADKSVRLVSAADAHAIACDVFDNRCAVSGAVDNLTWRRFDQSLFFLCVFFFFLVGESNVSKELVASPNNIVLLTEAIAKKHDKGEDVFGPAKKAEIAAKLASWK